MSTSRYLKSEFSHLEPREALQQPINVLLGVNLQAKTVLESLEIHSVFELALSNVFDNASKLMASQQNPTDAFTLYGSVPADMIDHTAENADVATLSSADITVLSGIGPQNGPAMRESMQVTTVRDLALWPPYLAAKALFQEVYNPEQAPEYDPEAPVELLPKSGVYPTERVFYKTILLDQIIDDASALRPLESSGPVDVSVASGSDFGFKKPAIGAILTHSQTWYTQGVALGQLLHSVALAPGESTKIAMIDWSRRTFTSVDESISESEALSNTMRHNRSISEVTQAVAREAQSGFSKTSSQSSSFEAGLAAGGMLGNFLLGGSAGYGGNSTQATSFATSSGRRNISATMLQDITDSTQQNANAARNRRASIVKEVSQAESEKVSTRVVTNYNHMHALSIQYYEVVQLYRVVSQLADVDKCLFIPMKVLNFEDPGVVQRFKHVLAAASLNPLMQQMLMSEAEQLYLRPTTIDNPLPPAVPDQPPPPPPGQPPGGVSYAPRGKYWMQDINALRTAVGSEVVESNGQLKLPKDIEVQEMTFMTSGVYFNNYTIERRTSPSITGSLGDSNRVTLSTPIPLEDIISITLQFPQDPPSTSFADMYLKLKVKNTVLNLSIPMSCPDRPSTIRAMTVTPGLKGGADLTAHLKANSLYYSQAIWQSLDAATLALLLSPFKYNNKPVMQIVDPEPVTIAGNFLVFRMVTDSSDTEWAKWLGEHGINRSIMKQEVVPLPSGGLFAEAVLGRFNAAEKLDMTRFWNWQDSPIPNQAPDIAPVQTGSRAQPDNTTPGNLSQPVINIMQPSALPDPQGMSAVLTAIQNGNMFRDMSGLAATIGLAQAGMQAASQAASHAATQAGTNMSTFANYQVEMMKTLLPLITAAMGAPGIGGAGGSGSNISEQGAKLNEGAKIDKKKAAEGSRGSTGEGSSEGSGGGSGGGSSSGSGSGSSGSAGGITIPQVGSGSHEEDAFNQSLGGGGPALMSFLSAIMQSILAATPPAPAKPVLKLNDKVPNKSETDAVGAISGKIVRGTPEFDALVKNTNPDIVFKDEEGTEADKMMSPRMKEKLDKLAELVKTEWSGKKLRVTECWDENNEHSATSTHYEGRAADLTVDDKDSEKLGRLAQLAVDAGFDWVFYENSMHIHVSVKKEEETEEPETEEPEDSATPEGSN